MRIPMNKQCPKRRSIAGIFAMAIVLAIQTGSANAQMITSVTNNLKYQYYSVQDYSDVIPELQTIITLQYKQVRMGDVLKEIAYKSNLGIAYNSDLSVLDKPINVNVKKATTSYALQTILLGSALGVNPYDQPAVELIKLETKRILT